MVLSKEILNNYKKYEEIKNLIGGKTYKGLTIGELDKIERKINSIKKLEGQLKEINIKVAPRNVGFMKKVNEINTIKVEWGKGKNKKSKDVKPDDYVFLYKKKQKGAYYFPKKKEKEIEKQIKKDIFFYVRNGKEKGKLSKKLKIIGKDDENIKVDLKITSTVRDTSNDRVRTINFNFTYDGKNDEDSINEEIEIQFENYVVDEYGQQAFDYFKVDRHDIREAKDEDGEILRMENMKLREKIQIFDLVNIFGEKIDINKSEKNCVLNAFEKLGEYHTKYLKNLLSKEKDYITAQEIKIFCQKFDIACVLYDYSGKIIAQTKSRNMNHGKFYFLCFNEHIYPIKNNYLNCVRKYDFLSMNRKNLKQSELEEEFINLIKKQILPAEIKVNKDKLISFIHEDTVYFNNPDFESSLELMKKYGIEDNIRADTKRNNLMNNIVKLYNDGKDPKSFFPFEFKKIAYTYVREDVDFKNFINDDSIKSIDAIKFYGQTLARLPYLIYCDYRYCKITKNPEEITEHFLYLVEAEENEFNNLMLESKIGIYWGKKIIEASEKGLKFKILEEIETEKKENFFVKLIPELLAKIDNNELFIKEVINIYYGKLYGEEFKRGKKKVIDAYLPKGEKNYHESTKIELNGKEHHFSYHYENSKYFNIDNNAPIAIQLIDMTHSILFEKINELKLKDDDIYGIFTDNIIFKDTQNIFKEDKYWRLVDKTNKEKFNCKYFNEFKNTDNDDCNIDFSFTQPKYIKTKNNILVQGTAGNGKSTKILNSIIPQLGDDYIILSPSHSTIDKYRQLKKNCDVIQRYTNTNTIPEDVSNIIIDEVGMVSRDGWLLMIKMMICNKRLIVLGDFNQLTPAFEDYKKISDDFLKSMFNKIIISNANWRNNIKHEEYEKMINGFMTDKFIDKYLKKYCNSDDPDVYLCVKKDTAKNKNLEILEKKGLYDPKTKKYKSLVGIDAICDTNDYAKHELYNNFRCKIIEHEEEKITIQYIVKSLVDGEIQEDIRTITMKERIFFKRFSFCWAIHIYKFQGEEARKIKFIDTEEERKLIKFNRTFYTIVSRFKEDLEDLTEETIQYNKTQDYTLDLSNDTDYSDILADE